MSQNTDLKDKIIVDPGDSEDIAALFSRMQPGDKISGEFTATLDDAGEKIATFSIDEIKFKPGADDESPEEDAGETDADEEAESKSAALSVIKNSDGVPDQPGNMPPDDMPTV